MIIEAAFLLDVVSFFELINTAARIYKLLLACKEGMALVANIHLERIHLFGRSRFKGSSARAHYGYFVIIGMYRVFHK